MSVRTEKQEHIWFIVLDRPETKNAVDREHAQALTDAFRAFEADASAKVGILWGTGGSFCGGADLKAIAKGNPNRLEEEGDGPMGPSRMVFSKPTIAAVSGMAVGGGFELALMCDLRIFEETASCGFLNRRWGVPLIDGGTIRLPRMIGLSRALDLILTGRLVDAQEAWSLGIANRLVPHGTARQAAEELARQMVSVPWPALCTDRMSAYQQVSMTFEEAIKNEFLLGKQALDSAFEGAKRFVSASQRDNK